jgi:hypothetical protein
MGLRIIRTEPRRTAPEAPDAGAAVPAISLAREQEQEIGRCLELRGASSAQQAEFMKSYRRAHDRVASAAEADRTAGLARASILKLDIDSALPHNQVDIATLLELL